MVMNRAIEGLQNFGDQDLARRLLEIQTEFQERHSGVDDIPLTGRLPQVDGAQKGESILTPLSPETQTLIEQMRRNGYAIYETTGRTPASLLKDNMRYWFLHDKLADITAPPALLAFRKAPPEFFLPESHNILHDEQLKLIPVEQARIDKVYPGAGLIIREGKLPEWTEIAWRHYETTKVRIFGRDYGYNYTWTDTYANEQPGADRASFGNWVGASGAHARLWQPGSVRSYLGLAPLVEILRK